MPPKAKKNAKAKAAPKGETPKVDAEAEVPAPVAPEPVAAAVQPVAEEVAPEPAAKEADAGPAAKPADVEPAAKEAEAQPAGKEADVSMEDAPAVEASAPAVKFEEPDAPEDSRKKVVADEVSMSHIQRTPNALTTADGRLLTTLCGGGLQYLLAGAKCNAGIKDGRYFFEVKMVESLNPSEDRSRGQMPQPRQFVRVGFSSADGPPILDAHPDAVYFDSEGNFVHQKTKTWVANQTYQDSVMGVLINLDSKSPNANTVSLYQDGKVASEPQALPEGLVGKVLFPTITYRNVTLHVNFGPTPLQALPFKCRMLRDAAEADTDVVASAQSDKPEVLFPIGLPDQGLFDWLDHHLEENPHCLEISDRKILNWAQSSGLCRQRGFEWRTSNDRPGMSFDLASMDDNSVQKALAAVAPALRRDLIIMEIQANLVASKRKAALANFPASDFKRVAVVAIGKPSGKYLEKVQQHLLTEKVKKAEVDKKKQAVEKERKKAEEERRKRMEQAAKERRKLYNKKKEEDDGDKEADAEEEKDDEKEDEPAEEEEKEEPIELTDEEKALWHCKGASQDLEQSVLNRVFAGFSLPADDEGFDDVRYVWQDRAASEAFMKEWVLERKKTQIAEELEPSEWFKERWTAWQEQLKDWRRAQTDARDSQRRKGRDVPAEEKKKSEDGEKEADEVNAEEGGEKKEMEVDEDEIDVATHENILDIGNGKPLFFNFVYEDWTLLSLRYELHLLVYAFRHDLADPDRPGFPEKHLAYYFNKYYKKEFDLKLFSVEGFADLAALIKENICLADGTMLLEAVMPEDTTVDKFLRNTEEHRRDRQRCIDAGDETASLKFHRPQPPQQRPQSGGYQSSRGGGSYDQRQQQRGPPSQSRYGAATYGAGGGGGGGGYGAGSGGGDRGQASRGGGYAGGYSGGGDRYSNASAPRTDDRRRPNTPGASYPPAKRGNYNSGGATGRSGSSQAGGGRSYR